MKESEMNWEITPFIKMRPVHFGMSPVEVAAIIVNQNSLTKMLGTCANTAR